ncbi:hypothetical protein DP194_25780, partial [Enterobacter hormaechei subsp. xiangfangensis]
PGRCYTLLKMRSNDGRNLLLLFVTVAPFILFKKPFFNIIILRNDDVKKCFLTRAYSPGLLR